MRLNDIILECDVCGHDFTPVENDGVSVCRLCRKPNRTIETDTDRAFMREVDRSQAMLEWLFGKEWLEEGLK